MFLKCDKIVSGIGLALFFSRGGALAGGCFSRPNKTRVQRSGFRFEEEDGLADMEFASLPRKRNVACSSDEAGKALLSRVGK